MEKEILLPKLGESILSATIIKWLKKEGDHISLDEPLLEVSTDKVASEIPSPYAGVLKKIAAAVDEEISVGGLLAVIETDQPQIKTDGEKISQKSGMDAKYSEPSKQGFSQNAAFLSPAVKKLIKEHHLSKEELNNIPCSGKRISRSDVEAYLESKKEAAKDKSVADSSKNSGESGTNFSSDTIVLSNLRKKIADNLTKACCIPTASVFMEVDITALAEFIEKNKPSFLEKTKAKLTITCFVAEAIGKAAKALPLLNSTFLKDKIRLNKEVNLGIAIDRKEGLVVPVVKQTEEKNYAQIAKEVFALKQKALEDKLDLKDIEGGTITLTNFGMGGVLFGIPILRFPESAIVGTGAIQIKNALTDEGKVFKRKLLPLSLTFDHRHIDGMYACSFMQKIKSFLEKKTW